jgi:hypothetical protein
MTSQQTGGAAADPETQQHPLLPADQQQRGVPTAGYQQQQQHGCIGSGQQAETFVAYANLPLPAQQQQYLAHSQQQQQQHQQQQQQQLQQQPFLQYPGDASTATQKQDHIFQPSQAVGTSSGGHHGFSHFANQAANGTASNGPGSFPGQGFRPQMAYGGPAPQLNMLRPSHPPMGESLIRPAGDPSLVGNNGGCVSENRGANYQDYASEAQLQLQQPQGYSVYVRTPNDGGNTSEIFRKNPPSSDANNIHTFIGRGLSVCLENLKNALIPSYGTVLYGNHTF